MEINWLHQIPILFNRKLIDLSNTLQNMVREIDRHPSAE